jgi:hypothetical protein
VRRARICSVEQITFPHFGTISYVLNCSLQKYFISFFSASRNGTPRCRWRAPPRTGLAALRSRSSYSIRLLARSCLGAARPRCILHCSPRSPTRADPPGVSAEVLASRGATAPGRLAPAPSPPTQTPLTHPQLLAELHPHSPVPPQYLPLGHWRCCSVTELVVALLFLLPHLAPPRFPRRCSSECPCSRS